MQRRFGVASSAQDHEVVGIGDEASAETSLKAELLPPLVGRLDALHIFHRVGHCLRSRPCPRRETGQRSSSHQSSEVPETADDSLPELYIPIDRPIAQAL